LAQIKRGERNAHSNRPFNPVHGQAFIKTMNYSLRPAFKYRNVAIKIIIIDKTFRKKPVNIGKGSTYGRIMDSVKARCLHSPPDNIQWIGSRLSQKAGYSTKE